MKEYEKLDLEIERIEEKDILSESPNTNENGAIETPETNINKLFKWN